MCLSLLHYIYRIVLSNFVWFYHEADCLKLPRKLYNNVLGLYISWCLYWIFLFVLFITVLGNSSLIYVLYVHIKLEIFLQYDIQCLWIIIANDFERSIKLILLHCLYLLQLQLFWLVFFQDELVNIFIMLVEYNFLRTYHNKV